MQSIETHVIQNPRDGELAVLSGLITQEHLDGDECANDGREVGHLATGFVPFMVVLNEDDSQFFLCTSCAQPILKPRS